MELMENQHKKENIDAQMVIDDLNHRIEAMTVRNFFFTIIHIQIID